MARRAHSLHHNLGDRNVVFHHEHRSKQNRTKDYKRKRATIGYLHERRERIVERSMKKHIRNFVKGVYKGKIITA